MQNKIVVLANLPPILTTVSVLQPTLSDCDATETDVKLSILTDDFPLETVWTIEDWQTETVVETGGTYQFTGDSVT